MSMPFNVNRVALVLLLPVVLSGCGYLFGDDGMFRDASDDYRVADEIAPIQVPDGLSDSALQDVYVIPQVEDDIIMVGEFEVPRPAPLVAGSSDQLVRIQKLGDESWALIAVAPGQVWPQVRSFLAAMGMQVSRVDAQQGIMETRWMQLQGKDMSSRFRFRIEQGVQRGNSELHVLQQSQAGDVANWPVGSDDLAQESEMLQSVAQYIANSTESAPVSMVAEQAISAGGKISLQEGDNGHTFIQLGLPFDRAWASVDRALQNSTFEVTDRNRSTGEFYVRFNGPQDEDDDGWFDWLFDEEAHPLAGQEFLVSLQSLSAEAVAIHLRPMDESLDFGLREEQSLLALLKGNIN
jgi:outer membrane protein assembly factor BamC